MSSHIPPPPCRACTLARNCINGRYCTKVARYVNYDVQPPCHKWNH